MAAAPVAQKVRTENGLVVCVETVNDPNNTTVFTAIQPLALQPIIANANRKVTVDVINDAAIVTNLTVDLYGSFTKTGSKVLLATGIVSGGVTTGHTSGIVDLNSYPCPYYFIGIKSTADNSANNCTVTVCG